MTARPIIIALFAAALAAPAAAQTTTTPRPGPIQQRLQMQAARIRAGVQAGRISAVERRRLVAGETAVRRRLQTMRQSGHPITPAQRRQIVRALNRLNLAIARANRK